MSRTSNAWLEELDRVGTEFVASIIDRQHALDCLKRLGFSATEASDHLDCCAQPDDDRLLQERGLG